MILFPAIDLYEKQVVRLKKGDYAQMTVYSKEPCKVAEQIFAAGAQWLHVVDLEGAKSGEMPNFSVIADICKQSGGLVELGGGIRTLASIERYLSAGVARVILGTQAVVDQGFLREAVKEFGEALAVGVDIRDGSIAIRGWKELADTPLDEFFDLLCELGVKYVICTDISKDGMLGGTNLELYQRLMERYPLCFTASGGVSSLKDLAALKALGLYGAILGKAMYTGAVDLQEALRVAEGAPSAERSLLC